MGLFNDLNDTADEIRRKREENKKIEQVKKEAEKKDEGPTVF